MAAGKMTRPRRATVPWGTDEASTPRPPPKLPGPAPMFGAVRGNQEPCVWRRTGLWVAVPGEEPRLGKGTPEGPGGPA